MSATRTTPAASNPYGLKPFPIVQRIGPAAATVAILGVSAAAVGFLIWLVYFRSAAGQYPAWVESLPAFNATFNSLSAVQLVLGYRAIRARNFERHMQWMLGALATSALFLVSYVVYHKFHGSTPLTGQGLVRPVYYFILASHILLSMLVVPMILASFYLAFAGKFAAHRRLSKWTFPIWLYVSVTGVLVFVILRATD